MNILVTGASGFIGRTLFNGLRMCNFSVRAAVHSRAVCTDGLDVVAFGNICTNIDFSNALAEFECVVHCAARAHVKYEFESNALAAYRAVNVEGTRRLAEQAAAAGVKRFVFLSSIGVLGIHTNGREPFSVRDTPTPVEDYAVSKWEAELALKEVAARTGLEVVIVRSPLVYGPGAKGNLGRLLGLVRSGLPLPLGAVVNRRSLIGLDNLVDVLIRCVDHPRAVDKTFLVSDGEDLSTPDLLGRIANAMACSLRLFPVPVPFLRLGGGIVGKCSEVNRLVGSLQVDSSTTREVLDWVPPFSVNEGIRKMVEGYGAN
jgi:nucleoside-diphosphate-sugar epimerase